MDPSSRRPSSGEKHIRFRSCSPSPTSSKKQRTLSTSITVSQTTTKHYRHRHSRTHTHSRSHARANTSSSTRRSESREITSKSSRQWVFTHHDCSKLKDEIVIVSYNILAVTNAEKHPYLYNGVSPKYLKWERRKRCIRRELNCYKASILCLQEVDRFSDLDDLLKADGYKGIYKARTGDAHDGCAIFWREDLFTLLHRESIEFREYDLRDNVAQFCVLKMKSNNTMMKFEHSKKYAEDQISQTQTVVIGNIHALFNPKRGDIKLGQIRLFVKKAQKLSREWGNIPIVIAGDLNSTPQSGIYDFLASSELNLLRHDRRELAGQLEAQSRWRPFRACSEVSYRWSKEELQFAAGSEGKTHLRHSLELRSAYVGVPGSSSTRDKDGEPLATTYHSNFMGTVDYIWHSKDLVPVGVLETLPVDALRKMRGLPSEEWGSDHFALVCKLAFAEEQCKEAGDIE